MPTHTKHHDFDATLRWLRELRALKTCGKTELTWEHGEFTYVRHANGIAPGEPLPIPSSTMDETPT